MVVACLPTHRFAQEKTALGPRELAGEAFVTFDRGLPVRREIDRFLRRHDADVQVAAEFDNIENIKQAIEDGAGVAILPEPTVRREVQRRTLVKVGLRTAAGDTPFVRPLTIIHRRKRRLNPAVTEFIKVLCAPNGAAAGHQSGGRPAARHGRRAESGRTRRSRAAVSGQSAS